MKDLTLALNYRNHWRKDNCLRKISPVFIVEYLNAFGMPDDPGILQMRSNDGIVNQAVGLWITKVQILQKKK